MSKFGAVAHYEGQQTDTNNVTGFSMAIPNDAGTLLILLGALFVLIGLLGGGLEVAAVKIPAMSQLTRTVVVVVGAALLVSGGWAKLGHGLTEGDDKDGAPNTHLPVRCGGDLNIQEHSIRSNNAYEIQLALPGGTVITRGLGSARFSNSARPIIGKFSATMAVR